ncbi:unnamed protein product [Acanthosepion pharaonis]|uniref:ASD2 domain-containing protein n=1 Tax=Acanthosepion pharaonis TaxID=158019 RepID=A0A812CP14_ACAPH|nr:unnamed protein product [Sepia pharaonis]
MKTGIKKICTELQNNEMKLKYYSVNKDEFSKNSANYSAPSPPERDLTLPHPPISSEALAWKKEKTLSPLSCEKHNVAHLWKEENDSDRFIQHGRSESLPIDSTHESPSLHLRSYYSCTDVYKGKPSERPSIYGVSDYMDMSGRHQKEWSQICSKMTDKASSNVVSVNTKKMRTSSCTSYRIHANFEPEEDPPPQLPPRAYRNMPDTSGNLNWIKEIVQATSLTDLSKGRPSQSVPNQNVTSPSQSELFIPSPILQTNSIHKMPSPESCSQKMQFHYRSSSEQCLTSIGSADQMKIPLYVSLVNIPTEEGLPLAVDKQRNLVSVKQRIHFFEYDSNGQLVGNRIPPPVPAKPTSLVLRKKVPKEEGFSPTQPSPEIDPSAGKPFNLLTEKPSEASKDITETADEKLEVRCNRTEHFQCNIKENVDTAADKISLLLPEAEEVRNNLEYFQQSATLQDEHIDKEVLIRKKNALRDSLRRKLDVLREAKLNVEAEIQEIDIMKKNICSQFENVCPNVNERRKLTDFFKDREMCQVLLSKLKVRITRLKNEMEETSPSHDLNDKLSKLEIHFSLVLFFFLVQAGLFMECFPPLAACLKYIISVISLFFFFHSLNHLRIASWHETHGKVLYL